MKTVLISGGNKGISFETAKQLAQLGYFIYIGCWDIRKGTEAIKKLNVTSQLASMTFHSNSQNPGHRMFDAHS